MARPKAFRNLTQKAGEFLRRRSSSHAPDRSVGVHHPLPLPDPTEMDLDPDDSSANGSLLQSPSSNDIPSLISSGPSPLSSQTSLASHELPLSGMCSALAAPTQPALVFPPSPESSAPPPPSTETHHQSQSSFFRRLPPEIREQIYIQYWLSAGIDRHVFLQDGEFCFAPCVVDHDDPVDECQVALAREFPQSGPPVQRHIKWFRRMTSLWCNHWRCEEALRRSIRRQQRQKQRDEDEDEERPASQGRPDKLVTCLPLLLACKRLYQESLPSLKRYTSLTITDKDTAHALLIKRRSPIPSRNGARHPIFAFLPHIQTLNISLRHDGPDFLWMHSAALWAALSARSLPGLRRISLWLDGWEPVSRRLIPQFRDLWANVPPAVARKLSVSFPCAADGLWAWDDVAVRVAGTGNGIHPDHLAHWTPDGGGAHDYPPVTVLMLPPLVPEFQVVLRGWEAYTANSSGWIARNAVVGRGGAGPKALLASMNPFEDLKLYGRGFFDPFYPL
ncbi:hypothetical protein B0T11DRAFT_67441 [Plectosphaerella cucumerina]|uniref:Uncharacterized protein n=1 Tax=Plectosphaerella cucumerina TaxID=40658 RepID=A0A8K0TLZ3_9PEZI|nr:hypothetical protein B0T11DRAFT_67441 [Plectosphaerella cucumerina]